MTWRDGDGNGNVIPFTTTDKNGKPMTNVTYDHDPPLAQRFNAEGGGKDQTREQRADDFNDSSKLTPMSRSDNSRKGARTADGQQQTYTPDRGPKFEE